MTLENILVVSLPFVTGFVVAFLTDRTKGTRFEVRGVVGPYFGAVAVIFAIYAGLMTNEVWGKIHAANAAISQEGDAVRSIMRLADALGSEADPVGEAARGYVEALRHGDWNMEGSISRGPANDGLRRLYHLAVELPVFTAQPAIARVFLDDLEKLRSARVTRYNLSRAGASFAKIATVFLFGLLTQIAIALVHSGLGRTIYVTVGLFSIAFATLFAVLTMFDRPFANDYLINKSPLSDLAADAQGYVAPSALATR